MKSIILFLSVALSVFTGISCAESPVLPLEKAVQLAQEQLKIRNLEKTVYIQSVALESTSLLGGNRVLKVSWSENLDASVGKVEVGVEVNMRGDVVRLVKRAGELPKH